MKKIILLSLMLIISTSVFASGESGTDGLMEEINTILSNNDNQESIRIIEEMKSNYNGKIPLEILSTLGSLYLVSGDLELSTIHLLECRERENEIEDNYLLYTLYSNSALLAYQKRDFSETVEYADKALGYDANDLNLIEIIKADSLAYMGNYDMALEIYDTSLFEGTVNQTINQNSGIIYLQLLINSSRGSDAVYIAESLVTRFGFFDIEMINLLSTAYHINEDANGGYATSFLSLLFPYSYGYIDKDRVLSDLESVSSDMDQDLYLGLLYFFNEDWVNAITYLSAEGESPVYNFYALVAFMFSGNASAVEIAEYQRMMTHYELFPAYYYYYVKASVLYPEEYFPNKEDFSTICNSLSPDGPFAIK